MSQWTGQNGLMSLQVRISFCFYAIIVLMMVTLDTLRLQNSKLGITQSTTVYSISKLATVSVVLAVD